MSVQRKKHTPASKGRRRSHMRLHKQILSKCKECGSPKQSHHLCAKCKAY